MASGSVSGMVNSMDFIAEEDIEKELEGLMMMEDGDDEFDGMYGASIDTSRKYLNGPIGTTHGLKRGRSRESEAIENQSNDRSIHSDSKINMIAIATD